MNKVNNGNPNPKPKGGPGRLVARNGSDQPIPHKGNESHHKGKKAKKYCSRCAKGNPGAEFTHNTKDCRKSNKEGNLNKSFRSKSKKNDCECKDHNARYAMIGSIVCR